MSDWMEDCSKTRRQGIWKTPTGYRVRVRAVDPRTGTLKARNQKFVGITLQEAIVKQAEMKSEILSGALVAGAERLRYGDYAASLYERKLAKGEISSARNRRTWADTQDMHLSHFNDFYVDAIRKLDVEAWLTAQAKLVEKGKYSPVTINNWLRILLTTLRAAVRDLDLERDPTLGVEPLDTSTWHTYTEEEPNSLTVEELRKFMVAAEKLYPQHYAMLALGFSTGRRPCEMRPLRRKGATPDILWKEGVLLVRRSEVMGKARETTKTNKHLRVPLPKDLVDILEKHANNLPAGPMRDSELLFPSDTGCFHSQSFLANPFQRIAKEAGIKKHLTPYCMRRTFQDLGRQAQVHDFVVRAISGHSTVEMQSHYGTVAGDEVRAGLAKVISLAGFAKATRGQEAPSGHPGGHPASPGSEEVAPAGAEEVANA
ncbi:MAG: site-specific integrase [Myxococcales bacterium]|nr:site-specific integrase [Myxococcales bacterium]